MHQEPFHRSKISPFPSGRLLLAAALSVLLAACAGGQVKQEGAGVSLGLKIMTLTSPVARDLGIPEARKGVLVEAVYQGSPAAQAGFRAGDLIVGVKKPGGPVLQAPDAETFLQLLKGLPEKEPVTLSVLRGGKEVEVSSLRSDQLFAGYVQAAPRTEPRTIKVALDGTGDCMTIAGAQILARPGDTILLSRLPSNGAYGLLEVYLDGVTIRSEDTENPTTVQQAHLFHLKGVSLEGLVFEGSGTPQGHWPGVFIRDCEGVQVRDCSFSGFLRAVTVGDSREVSIIGNRMEKNSAGLYVSASDFKIVGNLITGQPMPNCVSRGIWVLGGGGEITGNTILFHKLEKNTFIRSMSTNFGPDGAGISIVQGARVSVENNIVLENSAGVFLGTDVQSRVEYNVIFQNMMPSGGTGPEGIFGSTSFENYLTGGDWNISRGVQHRYEEAPLLSLSTWRHHYWGPIPVQISQTNLSQDPFFHDPVRGDYRLAVDSPLIGRGRGGTYIGAMPPVSQGAGEGAFR